MYVSLALDMEHPVCVDPPMDNAARCYRYTSSDEDDGEAALTTDDRTAGRRPMVGGPSQVGVVPIESAQGPSSGQGSASGARAPKRRQVLRVIDDDKEEEAPDMVHRPCSRPKVVLAPSARLAEDSPVA